MRRYNKKIIALASALTLMSTIAYTSALAYTKDNKEVNIGGREINKERPREYDEELYNVKEVKFYSDTIKSSFQDLRNSKATVSFKASCNFSGERNFQAIFKLIVDDRVIMSSDINGTVSYENAKEFKSDIIIPKSLSDDELRKGKLLLEVPNKAGNRRHIDRFDSNISNFVVQIDKSALIKKIDEGTKVIDGIGATGYFIEPQLEAFKALKGEVFSARDLLNSANLSQQQIDNKIANIDKAISEFLRSKLIPKEIDLSILPLISSSSAEYGYLNNMDDIYNIVNNYTGSDSNKIDRAVRVTVISDKEITAKFGDESRETGTTISRTIDICNKDKYPLVISGEKGCRYRIVLESTGGQFPNTLGYYYYDQNDVLKIGEKNVRHINYSYDNDTLSFKVDEPGWYSIEILPKDVCYENRFNALTIREMHMDVGASNNIYSHFNTVGFDPTGYPLKSLKDNVFYQIDIMGCNPTEYYVIIKKE